MKTPIFRQVIGARDTPNAHELALFDRARQYLLPLQWIPGIEMIAIVNSLSMYATHPDSDIDLFIMTKPGYLWLVRVLVTITLSMRGVWRRGADIAGYFCLSFYATTEAIDMREIAIEDDIYLYHWVKYMKPIWYRGSIYDEFLRANTWVEITEIEKSENLRYSSRVSEERLFLDSFYRFLNTTIKQLCAWHTIRSYERLGRPSGVIISDQMLKFHPSDRRVEIRDRVIRESQKK